MNTDQNKILYESELLDFSASNKYKGLVDPGTAPAISHTSSWLEVVVPCTFKQVAKSPQKDKWWSAMEVEMKSMKDRKVWHLVPVPKLKSVLGSRWVYNLKWDEMGKIVRFKARLVVQGYKQVMGRFFWQNLWSGGEFHCHSLKMV